MGVGKEIRRNRERTRLTQRGLAERADVAVAYLSRLENDRVTPTLRTLNRVAVALGVRVATLLDQGVPLEPPDRCPVSLSGRCILDEPSRRHQRRRQGGQETYGREELKALRLCNLLLQSGDRQMVRTLITVMNGLVALRPANKGNST